MPEILTRKEPLDHSLNDEDFFLPNPDEAILDSERISDTSEQAHQFADEMGKLGVRTKVLEGEHNPFPDMLRSLTLVDHDQLPNGPTVRLYRGVRPASGQEITHQVGYLLKRPIYDEYGHIDKVELENDETFQAVENFADNPSYRTLMEASKAASMSDSNRRFVNDRVKEIRRNLIMFPDRTLMEELTSQHVAAPWGVTTQDLSPFVATSLHPNVAAGRGGNTLMVLDVPLSDIAGLGEGSDGYEVLLTGSVHPEWITAVAELRYNEHLSVETLAPLVEVLGDQSTTPPGSLKETESHQKSRLNHEADLYEINQDLIEELLSTPNIDANALREAYDSQNIDTYQDALWVAADHYLKQIQATGRWLHVKGIHELYQFDDVTYLERDSQLDSAQTQEDDLIIDDSEPEPKELNIDEVQRLAKVYANIARIKEESYAKVA